MLHDRIDPSLPDPYEDYDTTAAVRTVETEDSRLLSTLALIGLGILLGLAWGELWGVLTGVPL